MLRLCFCLLVVLTSYKIYALPNLTPYKPSDWDGKIVVSRSPGNHTDDTRFGYINDGDDSYIDFSFINNGNQAASGFDVNLFITVPGVGQSRLRDYTNGNSLSAGYFRKYTDIPYTFTKSGNHTLTVVVDCRFDVTESNESDN